MTSVIPKVSKLSSHVIRVLGCNPSPMTLQGTNTYIIGTGKSRVLLDTGESGVNEYTENLKRTIDEHNVNLSRIIISHWHNDHIGGVSDVINALKLTDECVIQKIFDSDNDKECDDYKLTYLNGDDRLSIDGATLRVIATPGHTKDHLVLFLEEENAIFSGDCILGEGSSVFEDLHSYMNSLRIILSLSPSIIYPGHGPVINDPIPKINEYIAHREFREKQIFDALFDSEVPMTPIEIVKIVYRDTPEHLYRAAAYNVTHHLEKLIKDGKVGIPEKGTDKYFAIK